MWKMTLNLTWHSQGGREGKRRGEKKKEGSPVQNNLDFQPITLYQLSIFIDSLNGFTRIFFPLFQNVLSNSHAVFKWTERSTVFRSDKDGL